MRWFRATAGVFLFLALALLLQGQADNANAQAEKKRASSTPVASPAIIDEPKSRPSATANGEITYNYYGKFNYIPTKSIAPSLGDELAEAASASNIALVLLTVGLVYFGKKAADAARDSAKAAALALNIDRPYLIVDEMDHGEEEEGIKLPDAIRITLRNCGNGPAIIDKVFARMRPTDDANMPIVRDFRECKALIIEHSAIAAGGTETYISDISDSAMSIPDEVAVRSARKHLIVFGRSLYRDGLNRRYESAFLWVYSPKDQPVEGLKPFMYRGPDPYNYIREIIAVRPSRWRSIAARLRRKQQKAG